MSKELMLALPEVAYFVERVPVGRVVVKADPIQLRFFQHARDSNMPLKEQCRLFNIPWHARKIRAPQVTRDALKASKAVEPTVFSMVWPSGVKESSHWVKAVLASLDGYGTAARSWIAFNVVALGDDWETCKDYLKTVAPAKDLSPKTLVERAKAFAEERERARREQLAQWNMMDDPQRYYQHMMNILANNAYLQRDALQQAYHQQAYQPWGNAQQARTPQRHVLEDRSPIAYDAKLLEPFESGNLTVKLLHTHEEFAEEGKRMHHCVETYFPRAKGKGCFIVGVTKKGHLLGADKRVATAEFTPDWELIQAKGPANSNVGGDVHLVTALRAFGASRKELAAA